MMIAPAIAANIERSRSTALWLTACSASRHASTSGEEWRPRKARRMAARTDPSLGDSDAVTTRGSVPMACGPNASSYRAPRRSAAAEIARVKRAFAMVGFAAVVRQPLTEMLRYGCCSKTLLPARCSVTFVCVIDGALR